MASLPQDVAT